jgi:hypothetical protein
MDEPCSPWADGTTAPCIGEDGLTEAQAVAGVALASYLLWNITDRRWNGACTDTMRPGPDCCCSPSGCCGRHVALAGTPATAVTEVTIDGLVVPEAPPSSGSRTRSSPRRGAATARGPRATG